MAIACHYSEQHLLKQLPHQIRVVITCRTRHNYWLIVLTEDGHYLQ